MDLKRRSPAEIAGVGRRLLVIEPKRSVFNELHEDAEIAVVVKSPKTVKEIKGNEKLAENGKSQVGSG